MDKLTWYWHHNQARWASMLQIAADLSSMYELPRPNEREIRNLGGFRALPFFWWRLGCDDTASFIDRSRQGCDYDHWAGLGRREDRSLCFACICGVLRDRMMLSGAELDVVLGCSRGSVHDACLRWSAFTKDFRTMIFGLSGDLRTKGLRNLVLGRTA